NGRWIHNAIDGVITGCARGTSNCRDYKAGDPAFAIDASGFVPVNPAETRQLFRSLDQSHVSLARAAGHDPSAPRGAAAGPGGTTGSTGSTGGTGETGSAGTVGNVTGGSGDLGSCSSGCAPPPPPPPPPCTTAACLGVVTTTSSGSGSGPAFP